MTNARFIYTIHEIPSPLNAITKSYIVIAFNNVTNKKLNWQATIQEIILLKERERVSNTHYLSTSIFFMPQNKHKVTERHFIEDRVRAYFLLQSLKIVMWFLKDIF